MAFYKEFDFFNAIFTEQTKALLFIQASIWKYFMIQNLFYSFL